MTLFTKAQTKQLLANGRAQRASKDPTSDALDFKPVAKIFTPDAQCTWLVTELDTDGLLFGLCDLGFGTPEIGFVAMSEVCELRGPLGRAVERDRHFEATKTMAEYAEEARARGFIVT